MNNEYINNLGSERSVEVIFIEQLLKKYYKSGNIVLDIGGIPTTNQHLESFNKFVNDSKIDYRISDFRGGTYTGDFVEYDFKDQKFDITIFLSSLEHFPQCTESDITYREGYDKRGYEKALSILNENGIIILTVPYGKHRWQEYHQNYNWNGILNLTEGSTILEHYTYRLHADNTWKIEDPHNMEDIIYSDKAYGVGCFILQKNK
jgi:SAM-dependent methyltransferase